MARLKHKPLPMRTLEFLVVRSIRRCFLHRYSLSRWSFCARSPVILFPPFCPPASSDSYRKFVLRGDSANFSLSGSPLALSFFSLARLYLSPRVLSPRASKQRELDAGLSLFVTPSCSLLPCILSLSSLSSLFSLLSSTPERPRFAFTPKYNTGKDDAWLPPPTAAAAALS